MKKLTILLLLALFAAACGGSDDAASTADDSQVVEQAGDDATDADPDDSEPPANPAEELAEQLPPIQLEQASDRDCAHTVAELAGGDGAVIDVELPPNEKPEVTPDYLGEFATLETIDLIEGTGTEAATGSTVSMQYVGVLGADGTEFDSSWKSGQPFTFTLGSGQAIAGWDQGIVGMQVGGRRVLQIPSALAYGDQQRSEVIVADSDLVFIVDLIDVGAAPEPAPPIDDKYLGSFDDLEIIDLVEGEGCTVELGDIISVHYVGVSAEDGEEFDSSWGRGAPFELLAGRSQVIDAWNDGLVGMKVGGERILQIPADQAYDEGDLVFRVHVEALVEAPAVHQLEFEGSPPDETQVTTLVEGDGDGAESGDILDANIIVMLYKSQVIIQSTYQQGTTTQLALQEGTLLPGLEESVLGIKVGETRQIVLPPEVAYPDGVPANSGFEDDDAIVFIIEPLRIIAG